MQKTLVVIGGPTAIGKTSTTIKLAQLFKTVIISADSRQIFKEMTIGTAVPSTKELNDVKHYFIQNKSIFDEYNASMYEHEVLELLDDLFQKNDVVFMTGGSGMYIDAVCNGIDIMPDIDKSIREQLIAKFQTEGLVSIQKELNQVDHDYFVKIDINNHARIIRALEVFHQTGKPISYFQQNRLQFRNFNILRIALDINRAILHDRINMRVDNMINVGLLKEVENLFEYRALTPLKTVGYQELMMYLDNQTELVTAIELIKRNTRRYARKQLSWLRRNKQTQWFNPTQVDDIYNYIKSNV